MKDFKRIIGRLRTNEEIARKIFEIEIEILKILNFEDLFAILLSAIREKFGIPFVCVSLIEGSDITELVRSLVAQETLEGKVSFVKEDLLLSVLEGSSKPVLINEELERFHPFITWESKFLMRSLAVAPLFIDGRLAGSLVQADYTLTRFRPGIDTVLLDQLATIISVCLSNVTAHEQLRLLIRYPSPGGSGGGSGK